MENDQLVAAIHELEIKVLERIAIHTSTIKVNNERLGNLCVAVDRHREILFGHDDGIKPGLLQDMSSLKKTEKERRLTLRGVTLAFMCLVGKFCYDIWTA